MRKPIAFDVLTAKALTVSSTRCDRRLGRVPELGTSG
jgi:hypothetical protein